MVKKKIALIVVELETDETDHIEECVLDEQALSLSDEEILHLVEDTPAGKQLTAREKEVLISSLKSRRRKDIASGLFLSEATVKKHLHSIYAKLGVKNRFELISKIYRNL